MTHTESHFGLENIDGKISADGGKTFLPKFGEMTYSEFDTLVKDIEYHIEKKFDECEIADLIEILR